MKKTILLITFLIFSNLILEAQTQRNSTFGNAFTASGDLRILYVAVRFGSAIDNPVLNPINIVDNNMWHWNSPFPKEVLDSSAFYFDYSQFPQSFSQLSVSDADSNNVSLWYYLMSGGKFRMIVDTVLFLH